MVCFASKALIYARRLFMPSEILAPIYFGVELAAIASEALVLVSNSFMLNAIVLTNIGEFHLPVIICRMN
jgi:hypothetical protein